MAPLQATARSAAPDDRDFPLDDAAVECLAQVQVNSFAASPSTVEPFGTGATLRWNVSVPTGCRVGIRLNGRRVNASGSLEVEPAATTRYTLSAHMGRASRTLDGVTVRVDTSACVTRTLPESLIRSLLRGAVTDFVAGNDELSLRKDPDVEVDGRGIHVALRFKLAVDNFTDPDVDVDFTVGLRVRNGTVDPFYQRYSTDVDWPWWVTTITAGVTKIVEEFLDEEVEKQMKPRILAEMREVIDDLVAQLPDDMRLYRVRPVDNEISVTACPAGERTPFLVIATHRNVVVD